MFLIIFSCIAWHMRKIGEFFNALSRFEKIIMPREKLSFLFFMLRFFNRKKKKKNVNLLVFDIEY